MMTCARKPPCPRCGSPLELRQWILAERTPAIKSILVFACHKCEKVWPAGQGQTFRYDRIPALEFKPTLSEEVIFWSTPISVVRQSLFAAG